MSAPRLCPPSIGRTLPRMHNIWVELRGLHAQGWLTGIALGFLAWFVVRHVIFGFYTVDQNERAVVTSFGRAKRILGATTVYTPEGAGMRDSEKERYAYPQVEVVQGRRFHVEGPAMALVDLDGETVGRLPMTASVIPKALTVRSLI